MSTITQILSSVRHNPPTFYAATVAMILLFAGFLNPKAPTPMLSPGGQLLSIAIPNNSPGAPDTEVTDSEQPGECHLSATFSPSVRYWEKDICRWSEEHKMDPDLIATIMQIESCGDHKAVSATGVRGLFQVTGANLDGQNPFDPNVSMAKGPGKVLKSELIAAGGDVRAALAGYNGGPWARQWAKGQLSSAQFISRLRNHPSGFWRSASRAQAKLNEVAWYANWSNIYFEAKENKSDTVNQWLAKGGSRLCTNANVKLGLNNPQEVVASEVTTLE